MAVETARACRIKAATFLLPYYTRLYGQILTANCITACLLLPVPWLLPHASLTALLLPSKPHGESHLMAAGLHLNHRRQTQGPRAESGLHLVASRPAPCFYPAAAPSSRLTVNEQLHSYSPNVTFSPLEATKRVMWPPVKMSLTPLI